MPTKRKVTAFVLATVCGIVVIQVITSMIMLSFMVAAVVTEMLKQH